MTTLNKNNNIAKSNYFSDDESEEDNINDDVSEIESDDSMDEDTKRIIWEASIKNFEKMEQEKKHEKENMMNKLLNTSLIKDMEPETKLNNVKPKKTISLNDFNKKVEQDEQAKKPKKFISKRVQDKKKLNGDENDSKPKRNFNPRFPPYNFVHNKQKQNTIQFNPADFPSLK